MCFTKVLGVQIGTYNTVSSECTLICLVICFLGGCHTSGLLMDIILEGLLRGENRKRLGEIVEV